MNIICFSGPKGSGKSTLARKVLKFISDGTESFEWNFMPILRPLAEPIKKALHDWTFDELYNPPEETKEYYRTQYQSLGDWGRNIDPMFWVKIWNRRVRHEQEERAYPLILLVEDLRFRAELEYFKTHNTLFFRFEGVSEDPHNSEHDLDDVSDVPWFRLRPRADLNFDIIKLEIERFLTSEAH